MRRRARRHGTCLSSNYFCLVVSSASGSQTFGLLLAWLQSLKPGAPGPTTGRSLRFVLMPGARSSVALAAVVLAAALLARGCDSKIVRASFVAADVAAGAAPVMLTSLADRLDIVILAGAPAASLCTNPFDGRACRVDVKASCEAARNPNKVDVLIPAFYDETQDDVAWRVRWRPDHDLARSVPQCTATPLLNGRQFAFATPLKISLKLPSATNGPTAPPGFAKVAPNKQYFVDSGSGDLLFPVGPNLAWSGGANSTKGFYGPAFTQLAAAGANYVRLWWGPSQAAYSPFSDTQLQRSLGKVDAGGAANVDWVLDQAEASGIRALAALDSYNSLCTNKQYFCSWSTSVYNKQNGGPLSQPDDFWTDSTSMNAFQDYARYVVSRWGASTSVFSWQSTEHALRRHLTLSHMSNVFAEPQCGTKWTGALVAYRLQQHRGWATSQPMFAELTCTTTSWTTAMPARVEPLQTTPSTAWTSQLRMRTRAATSGARLLTTRRSRAQRPENRPTLASSAATQILD